MTLTFLLTDIEARPACGRKSTTRRWREADFLGRIALGRRFGPGMTQPRRHRRSWTTGRRQPAAISKRIPQHAVRRTTGVPDLFPGPVLASLRANPDRPAFEIGPRTVSRGDLLAMVRRLAAVLRDAGLGRVKASDAAGNAEVAAGSAHQHGVDPVSALCWRSTASWRWPWSYSSSASRRHSRPDRRPDRRGQPAAAMTGPWQEIGESSTRSTPLRRLGADPGPGPCLRSGDACPAPR